MASFLQKLRTVTLGSAHDLLDHAIDMNSPSALRQSIRDFEDAQARLETELAVQDGQERTLAREIGDLEHSISDTTTVIAKVLAGNSPNKEQLARAKGLQVIAWQSQLASKKTAQITQRDVTSKLELAVNRLGTKHGELVSRLRQLESLDRETKANEHMAGALSTASALVSSGADLNVDDIEGRMRARHDVSTAKLDRALAGTHIEEDPQASSAVDDLLNQLRPQTAVAS